MTDEDGRSTEGDSPFGNRSVNRALAMLELLARAGRPASLAEIAKELEIPKSSALSLLRALSARRFVEVDDAGKYVLGLQTVEVGAAYLRWMTPVRAAQRELISLTEELSVTSHFAMLVDDEVVYLAKHDPPGTALRLASSLGARLPAAVTAVGKVQLAHSTGGKAVQGASLRLAAELKAVREAGYATDDGQTAAGIRCVAAPVFSDRGCCGAIGVSYLLHGAHRTEDVVAAVVRAAAEASLHLGGTASRINQAVGNDAWM